MQDVLSMALDNIREIKYDISYIKKYDERNVTDLYNYLVDKPLFTSFNCEYSHNRGTILK